MAVPTRPPEDLVQCHEEDGMVDREGERDVPHVSRTMDVIQTTGPTGIILPTGPQGWVVEATYVGMQQAVECIRIGNFLAADFLDLFARVGKEPHRREAVGGGKSRIQAPGIHHD